MRKKGNSSKQKAVSSPRIEESEESKELALQVRSVNERQITEGQKVLMVKLPSMISRLSEYIQVSHNSIAVDSVESVAVFNFVTRHFQDDYHRQRRV